MVMEAPRSRVEGELSVAAQARIAFGNFEDREKLSVAADRAIDTAAGICPECGGPLNQNNGTACGNCGHSTVPGM